MNQHVWLIGVRNVRRGFRYTVTGLNWFRTRKECQQYIDTDSCIAMWREPGENQLEYKPLKAAVQP